MTDEPQTPDPASCFHPELRLSADGCFCNSCGVQIDDDTPIAVDPRADLKAVHEIDQAHASANTRIDGLMTMLDQWQKISINQSARDATENPMVFITLMQIMRTRVAADELPYLLAAAVMKLAATVVKT